MATLTAPLPVILGAGGFIGRRLSLALLKRDYRIRLVDRSYSAEFMAALEQHQHRVEIVEGNIESPAVLDRAVTGTSAVFHLLTSSVPITSPVLLDVEINVNLPNTLRILHAMLRAGVERIVYPSSGGAVYGEGGTDPIGETTPLRPVGAYGMGKLLAEETLRYYRRVYGLKDLIARISNGYGAWERSRISQGAVDVFLHRHSEGKPVPVWGAGAAVRDHIHIDDIVEALILLYEREVHGIEVNVGSGVGHSVMDVIAIIGHVSGTPVKTEQVEGMYSGIHRNVLDVGVLEALTGFRARTSLEEGIARSWDAITASGPERRHHRRPKGHVLAE
jgi:UDP-glucose 4-epimerase